MEILLPDLHVPGEETESQRSWMAFPELRQEPRQELSVSPALLPLHESAYTILGMPFLLNPR